MVQPTHRHRRTTQYRATPTQQVSVFSQRNFRERSKRGQRCTQRAVIDRVLDLAGRKDVASLAKQLEQADGCCPVPQSPAEMEAAFFGVWKDVIVIKPGPDGLAEELLLHGLDLAKMSTGRLPAIPFTIQDGYVYCRTPREYTLVYDISLEPTELLSERGRAVLVVGGVKDCINAPFATLAHTALELRPICDDDGEAVPESESVVGRIAKIAGLERDSSGAITLPMPPSGNAGISLIYAGQDNLVYKGLKNKMKYVMKRSSAPAHLVVPLP